MATGTNTNSPPTAKSSGRSVPWQFVARRPGDVATCYADPTLAERLLGWRAVRSLADMCADAWRWQQALMPLHQTAAD